MKNNNQDVTENNGENTSDNLDILSIDTKMDTSESVQTSYQWTAGDGQGIHQYYEGAVEDAFDQTAESEDGDDREVYSEEGTVAGYIDTFICRGNDGIVIDYKSHDMQNWSVSDARRYAQAHGLQVQGYVEALKAEDNHPNNVTGYVFACNRLPSNPEVFEAYKSTLAQYGIQVISPVSGEAEDVVKEVGKLIKKHGL